MKKSPVMVTPCQSFALSILFSAPKPVEWLSQTSLSVNDPSHAPARKWLKLHQVAPSPDSCTTNICPHMHTLRGKYLKEAATPMEKMNTHKASPIRDLKYSRGAKKMLFTTF